MTVRVTDTETGDTGTAYEVPGLVIGTLYRPPLWWVQWDEAGVTGEIDIYEDGENPN